MKVSWYPRNIVAGLLLFAVLAVMLNAALNVYQGVAVGLFGIAACAIVDLIFTFNPAVWQARRRPRSSSSLPR
jgi:hypothetical protein